MTSTFPGVSDAAAAQHALGWRNLLVGFISSEWAAAQQRYYEWLGRRRTGRHWAQALICKLWDVAWDLWEHRNGILHDSDTDRTAKEVTEQIRAEYAAGARTLGEEDRQLFRTNLTGLLGSPLAVQQAWLASVKLARARASRRVDSAFGQERRAMQAWLGQ